MNNDTGVVREVLWAEICPCLVLLRVFRISTRLQALLLAAVGAVTMTAGWRLADRSFLVETSEPNGPTATEIAYLSKWPGARTTPVCPYDKTEPAEWNRVFVSAPSDPVISLPYRMTMPFWRAMERGTSWRSLAYYLSGGLWTVIVWAFFGGAITRMAIVQLGRDERVDLRTAMVFGRKKIRAHIAGPLMPLVGVVFVIVPLFLLGWIMQTDVGAFLGGFGWLLVLGLSSLMVLLLTALLVGWPLMWAAICAEGSDGFDAISRVYAYTLQRPLHYLFYAFLASILGLLGWLLVWGISEAVVALGFWGVYLGTGEYRMTQIVAASGVMVENAPTGALAAPPSWALEQGARLAGLWVAFVRSLASGYAYAYFWCAAAAVYLLLRKEVDATEFDEIHIDEEDGFGLPKIKEDTADLDEVTPTSSTDRDDAH